MVKVRELAIRQSAKTMMRSVGIVVVSAPCIFVIDGLGDSKGARRRIQGVSRAIRKSSEWILSFLFADHTRSDPETALVG